MDDGFFPGFCVGAIIVLSMILLLLSIRPVIDAKEGIYDVKNQQYEVKLIAEKRFVPVEVVE